MKQNIKKKKACKTWDFIDSLINPERAVKHKLKDGK